MDQIVKWINIHKFIKWKCHSWDLINSDPDSNTGIYGVDYDLQLRLDANKKKCSKIT